MSERKGQVLALRSLYRTLKKLENSLSFICCVLVTLLHVCVLYENFQLGCVDPGGNSLI